MSRFFAAMTVVSAAGYQGFNSALDLGFVPLPPGKYASTDRHRWRNATTSCFSAFVLSVLAVYCLFTKPKLLLYSHTYYASTAEASLAIATGYFLYDTWDILIHSGVYKKWGVLLHHVLVALSYYVMATYRAEMGLGIISLLPEISAVFLHSRQVLLIYGFSKDSSLYRVHRVLNIATAITCRLAPIVFNCYLAATGVHPEMPRALAFLAPLIPPVILAINSTMIWRLLHSDFLSTKIEKVDFIMEN
ncbi:TLC domain-containing protein 2-like [Acanthaster planci]|uniref:TLC domain-containing protein 2-like n=1 Tax=Acanthaster planci TaxID=133434 RepID=A0A8B7ZDJ4_ACAPL|nr:TLC domain-containing protein 2-like [Acanthaster planci]